MNRWTGRVALVTGASAGIGAAICRELVKFGVKVIGCARNEQRLKDLSEEMNVKNSPGSIFPIKCDLTQEHEIFAMFEIIRKKFKRIDICINNAGMHLDCPLLTGSTSDWRTMIDVHVVAVCICTRESIKLMKENNIDGQIINISSMSGHRIPPGNISMYAGTKHMLRALSEGLRRELKADKSHIRVASISPGFVETELEYRYHKDDPDKARAVYASLECMQPEDIASCVTYILANPKRVDVNDVLMRAVEQYD